MTTLHYLDSPRTLAIKPPSNISKTVLFLRHDPPSASITFSEDSTDGFRLLQQRPIHGIVGIVTVAGELFAGVITEASRVTEFEGHDVFVINKVMFYSITSSRYDKIYNNYENNEYQIVHPCLTLIKLLSTGSFYFSHTLDLTRDLRSRIIKMGGNVLDGVNSDFVWNKAIMAEMIRAKHLSSDQSEINNSGILVPIIQGFVGSEALSINGSKWVIGIISRLSSNRAGTRFNARGINDDGDVSNFVETEFLIYCGHSRVSFLQIRGSVPLFWEQTGVQVSHKVKISRGLDSSLHATRRHFEDLQEAYTNIQIVNLLSQSNVSPEYELNMLYKRAIDSLEDLQSAIQFHAFDFHAIVKRDQYHRLEELAIATRSALSAFGYSLYDASLDVIVQQQSGIFRTNCLDCLDRTNVVQTLFAKEHLKVWITQLGMRLNTFDQEKMDASFNNLWADVSNIN